MAPGNSERASATDGRQARWERHNRDRRQHIVSSALDVLTRDGVEGLHVQQVGVQAGIGRSVIYRHFADRADLDRAVQVEILDRLRAELAPVIELQGTGPDVVRRIVGTYVRWADQHPVWHQFATRPTTGDGPQPVLTGLSLVASQIGGLIELGASVLAVSLDDDERRALDPMVFGLIGAAFATVARWLEQSAEERAPRETLIAFTSEAIWVQISGLAATRGLVIPADVPLETLLAEALRGLMDPAASQDESDEQSADQSATEGPA